MVWMDLNPYVRFPRQKTDKGDKMDIYDMTVSEPKSDILRQQVRSGQKVKIVRMVTISYTMDVSDVSDIIEGYGETDISVESLIQAEVDNTSIWELSDLYGDTDVEDDLVIAVEIS